MVLMLTALNRQLFIGSMLQLDDELPTATYNIETGHCVSQRG